MNKENGDPNDHAAEPPYSDLAEWQAQVKLARGLSARVTLCFAFGDPSIVDLDDALQTIDLIRTLVANLHGESLRRSKAGGGQ